MFFAGKKEHATFDGGGESDPTFGDGLHHLWPKDALESNAVMGGDRVSPMKRGRTRAGTRGVGALHQSGQKKAL